MEPRLSRPAEPDRLSPTERHELVRFRHGERDAFGVLMRPHLGSLRALARRASGDQHWAEDLLQLITQVQRHHRATLVMSLHQPDLARRFAERIIGLRKGKVVLDSAAAAVTDASLKELYRGDDSIPLNDAAGRPRTSQTRTA